MTRMNVLLSVSLLFGSCVFDVASWEHPQRVQKVKTDEAQILYAKERDLCSKKRNDKACQKLLDYLEDVYYSSGAQASYWNSQYNSQLPQGKSTKNKKKNKLIVTKKKTSQDDDWKSVVPKEQDKKFAKFNYRINKKDSEDFRAELDKYRQESGQV